MPATKTGLFKGHHNEKEIQEEILKTMEMTQAKTENMDIVLNGPRKDSVRGEGRSVQENEKDHRLVFFGGGAKATEIRTPLLLSICVDSGLHIVTKQHELQHGDCPKVFSVSAGRTTKTRIRRRNQS